MTSAALEKTINEIAVAGKGILAADESTATIKKRFQAINLESTEENRRAYRELLFATPGINEFINGVILFEETLYQTTSDKIPFPQFLAERGIVPGIKVDKGTIPLVNFPGDKFTEGLDGLAERLKEYKKQGARFAKWRAVLPIALKNPHPTAIKINAIALAHYAAVCQEQEIVPIVEPELLMEGDHSIDFCSMITEEVLYEVFYILRKYRVILEYMILKPSMVISGNQCPTQAGVTEVAEATLKVLRKTVPANVATINFLSGGQLSEVATAHLNAMNASPIVKTWNLSFSYGRALQDQTLKAWGGKVANVAVAQQQFYKRAKLNSLACFGKYNPTMELE